MKAPTQKAAKQAGSLASRTLPTSPGSSTAPVARGSARGAGAGDESVPRGVDTVPPTGLICGVDEAGRGPLAGPVVAAAVILDPAHPIAGLDDSKVLSAKKREALYVQICEHALAFCVAEASVEEIDTLNILQATMLAMQRAVEGLALTPALAQIDGNRCPSLAIPAQAIIGGDALVPAISAASILAKVTRDRQLVELHQAHPQYGFDVHAGYGTARHMQALEQYGPCVHHRRSFAPVRNAWARLEGGRLIVEAAPAASGEAATPTADAAAHSGAGVGLAMGEFAVAELATAQLAEANLAKPDGTLAQASLF
jgi:ribonuclease HII